MGINPCQLLVHAPVQPPPQTGCSRRWVPEKVQGTRTTIMILLIASLEMRLSECRKERNQEEGTGGWSELGNGGPPSASLAFEKQHTAQGKRSHRSTSATPDLN